MTVYYRVTSTTHIAKVPMKKLLSHYGCESKGNKKDMSYLKSDQEEADTKIVLHALDATASGATEIRIHSPDTDVFILCLRRYPDICQNTVFVTGKGQNYREINLQPIIRHPRKPRASTGRETGRFNGEGDGKESGSEKN